MTFLNLNGSVEYEQTSPIIDITHKMYHICQACHPHCNGCVFARTVTKQRRDKHACHTLLQEKKTFCIGSLMSCPPQGQQTVSCIYRELAVVKWLPFHTPHRNPRLSSSRIHPSIHPSSQSPMTCQFPLLHHQEPCHPCLCRLYHETSHSSLACCEGENDEGCSRTRDRMNIAVIGFVRPVNQNRGCEHQLSGGSNSHSRIVARMQRGFSFRSTISYLIPLVVIRLIICLYEISASRTNEHISTRGRT